MVGLFILMACDDSRQGVAAESLSKVTEQVKRNVPDYDFEIMTVSGNSMLPTLKPGDKVRLVRETGQNLTSGDMVAIQMKTRNRMMVKRIIARAGDSVVIDNGYLVINGERLNTKWWPVNRRLAKKNYRLLVIQLSRYGNRVPNGNLIAMGDNTTNSYDSGDFGMLSMSQIMGRIYTTGLH